MLSGIRWHNWLPNRMVPPKSDAYKSVNEALKHAGLKNRLTVNIRYVDSQDIESKGEQVLNGLDAILVPGGF